MGKTTRQLECLLNFPKEKIEEGSMFAVYRPAADRGFRSILSVPDIMDAPVRTLGTYMGHVYDIEGYLPVLRTKRLRHLFPECRNLVKNVYSSKKQSLSYHMTQRQKAMWNTRQITPLLAELCLDLFRVQKALQVPWTWASRNGLGKCTSEGLLFALSVRIRVFLHLFFSSFASFF